MRCRGRASSLSDALIIATWACNFKHSMCKFDQVNRGLGGSWAQQSRVGEGQTSCCKSQRCLNLIQTSLTQGERGPFGPNEERSTICRLLRPTGKPPREQKSGGVR